MEAPTNLSTKNDVISDKKIMDKKTKIFLAIVIFAAVLIIGLIISIIVVKVNSSSENSKNNGETYSESEEDTEEEYDDLTTAPINKKTYNDKLALEKSDLEDPDDINALINLYQKYIDAFQNETEDKYIVLGLYDERINDILELDTDNKYGDQVIADIIAIDDILQTITSAANVYNIAFSYGRTDVMEQYEKIMQERANNSDSAEIVINDTDEDINNSDDDLIYELDKMGQDNENADTSENDG